MLSTRLTPHVLLAFLLMGGSVTALKAQPQPTPPPGDQPAATADAGTPAPSMDGGATPPRNLQARTSGDCVEGGGVGPAAAGTTMTQGPSAGARAGGVSPGRMVTEKQAPLPARWKGEVTDVTEEERAEYERTVEEFAQGAADFRQEISDLVQAQYRERRARLKDEYELRIQQLEKEEVARRVAAIERFEKFLAKYPRDPVFSPDAIFRLAELYFEQASDEYRASLGKFDEDVAAFERGDLKVEPVQPETHYEKTIALYQRMITEFSNHRLIDGAYYLLGYCLNEQGEADQAIVQFLELTRRFPQSRYFSEAWMRVGEYYFDSDKLPEAIAAYTNVVEAKDSPYFDKALYKLGWAHYRLNHYDEAITHFQKVLDFSTQKRAEGGTEGSDLETESLQYIAVSLSDETWDRGINYDGVEDESGEAMVDFAEKYFAKQPNNPFAKDIFVRLGDILFDASKYAGAVRSFHHALQFQPLAPDAPGIQDKIVQAWDRARDFQKSGAARDYLVSNFSECTPWYNANKDNIEAIRSAQNLARTSLYSSAIFHHQQAQKYVGQEKFDLAKIENEQAARGYGAYLKRFPHDKAAYELGWYLADTLFNSTQFREAANEYAKIRDTNQGTKYRAEAAANVYFSLQKYIEVEEAAGRLVPKKPLVGGDVETLPPPEEIPEIKKELIDACDKYVERVPEDPRVPAVKAAAAEILYTYSHFDEARPRLEDVIEHYPTAPAAQIAATYIMKYLLTKKDWVAVEKFAVYVQQRGVGDLAEAKTIELGALFQKAKLYMDEGESLVAQGKSAEGNKRLEEAAGEYVRLVEQNKEHEFADKALFNAAVAYVKANRFESALKLYERVYSEYPKSDLAATALWRVADNAYKSYDFQKAIDSYFLLIKKYPKSENRADAQYNAAQLLENLQQYDRAAREYENYAKLFPDRDDAAAVFYRAVGAQEKRGDNKAVIDTVNRFLAKYKKDPKQTDNVVEAYSKLADIALSQGKQKDAEKFYEMAVDEFASRKANSQTVAGFQAARSKFKLAEFALKKYEVLKVGGKSKEQITALQKKSGELKKMEKFYQDVLPYKQLEWSLASAYRLGYLYENLAESVLAAPCPPDVKRVAEEACDEYRVLLEDKFAAPLEQKAVTAYKVANAQATESKFQNEWTRLTLEGIHKYEKDFPVDKEPRREMVGDLKVGLDVVAPVGVVETKSLKGK
jgi:tetratricopeptide (TPR) repeat protein